MPTSWRIVKSKYTASAFDGEGARINGGRWNSVGTRMVYTAHSRSLTILEVLVHLEKAGPLPSYSLVAARFDEGLVENLDHGILPRDWRENPAPTELRRVGDAWARDRTSAVLELPSAVVVEESIYLINPDHPDFGLLEIGEPEPFMFDPRLFLGRP